jgi:hypothetical protein
VDVEFLLSCTQAQVSKLGRISEKEIIIKKILFLGSVKVTYLPYLAWFVAISTIQQQHQQRYDTIRYYLSIHFSSHLA